MIRTLSVVASYVESLEKKYRETDDRKPVRNLSQAEVLLDMPAVRQSTDHDCGSSCLTSVFAYYGYDLCGEQIAKEIDETGAGSDPEEFRGIANELGLKCDIRENMSYGDLRRNLDDTIPVILTLQAWGNTDDYSDVWKEGHYVVAIGYDKNGFYFMDPSQTGYGYLSEKDIDGRWHDTKKDRSRKYTRLGIIIYGKKPRFNSKKIKRIET